MHRHQLQRVGAFGRLVLARLERSVREEGRKIVLFSFVHERGRRVHELVQVLDPVGAVPFGLVVGDEPALLEHDLHGLGQRQPLRFRLERFDEAQERGERRTAFPGKSRGRLV